MTKNNWKPEAHEHSLGPSGNIERTSGAMWSQKAVCACAVDNASCCQKKKEQRTTRTPGEKAIGGTPTVPSGHRAMFTYLSETRQPVSGSEVPWPHMLDAGYYRKRSVQETKNPIKRNVGWIRDGARQT